VQWIQNNDGDWILRNPEAVTFVQLDDLGKEVVERLGTRPMEAIAHAYDLSSDDMKALLQQLAVTGMLEGTQPPKPPKKKFTPMQLLFFKWSLWNPDSWLTAHINQWQWIWSRTFWLALCTVLAGTGAIALHQRTDLLWTAQLFLSHLNFGITAIFAVLALVVVTLHELGHAFTLKHYGGIVPEVGVMFMFFMPIAYTNTTDQYSLPKRSQRMLVVGAGVLCQLIIATFAFWLWNSSASGSWLWVFSYLLFAASIFTVAINLNPLAKFDGYYLAVAATGINNLRQRSFEFYRDLLTLKPSPEEGSDRWVLAAYAPFSLLYTLSIFGFLILGVADWTLTHIPFTAVVLLAIWATYFYLVPEPKS
jgi:putative peptide zinc metalloprotease protein